MQQTKDEHLLDTRGQLCPMPVIRASQAINRLPPQAVLKIVASDPGSWADIPAWAEAWGHQLLAKERDGKGLFTFRVQRA